jgi:hypothetical protein
VQGRLSLASPAPGSGAGSAPRALPRGPPDQAARRHPPQRAGGSPGCQSNRRHGRRKRLDCGGGLVPCLVELTAHGRVGAQAALRQTQRAELDRAQPSGAGARADSELGRPTANVADPDRLDCDRGARSLTDARPPHPQTLKSTPPMTVGTPPETRSTGRSRWTSGTVERRETCINKRIEAIVVTPPAPSRDVLSARTAPVATRLRPTPEPTPVSAS